MRTPRCVLAALVLAACDPGAIDPEELVEELDRVVVELRAEHGTEVETFGVLPVVDLDAPPGALRVPGQREWQDRYLPNDVKAWLDEVELDSSPAPGYGVLYSCEADPCEGDEP